MDEHERTLVTLAPDRRRAIAMRDKEEAARRLARRTLRQGAIDLGSAGPATRRWSVGTCAAAGLRAC
jgi:hypothetical protein